jgi:hypothetical protein
MSDQNENQNGTDAQSILGLSDDVSRKHQDILDVYSRGIINAATAAMAVVDLCGVKADYVSLAQQNRSSYEMNGNALAAAVAQCRSSALKKEKAVTYALLHRSRA